MKIGVTGYKGFVGSEFIRQGCLPLDCNITKVDEIRSALKAVNPDVIVHCAALTNVDYLETNYKPGFDVNVLGTDNLIQSISPNTLFVYLSSDHIFSGRNFWSLGYNERSKPSPVNRYGFSKWGGELVTGDFTNSLIVRTSKLYNYVWLKPTIDKLNQGETIEFTNIIKRSFMYLPHFVRAVLWTIDNIHAIDVKTLHISGESVFSYYLFWSIVQNELKLSGKIVPRNIELEDACPRPLRAGLNTNLARKLKIPMGSMQDAMDEIKEQLNAK